MVHACEILAEWFFHVWFTNRNNYWYYLEISFVVNLEIWYSWESPKNQWQTWRNSAFLRGNSGSCCKRAAFLGAKWHHKPFNGFSCPFKRKEKRDSDTKIQGIWCVGLEIVGPDLFWSYFDRKQFLKCGALPGMWKGHIKIYQNWKMSLKIVNLNHLNHFSNMFSNLMLNPSTNPSALATPQPGLPQSWKAQSFPSLQRWPTMANIKPLKNWVMWVFPRYPIRIVVCHPGHCWKKTPKARIFYCNLYQLDSIGQ